MTFVAQPYEQFVDDLLTAMTGGMTREEHRFLAAEEGYRLASPGVLPATLKVCGQHRERFTLFEGGIDYDYDPEKEAVGWKAEGRRPDEGSFFYLNYYLGEGRRRLTDRNPGSVTTLLAETFGRELAVLHKQMEMIYRSAFVDLAEGTSLDHVAALLGLDRRDARFATGEVLFQRPSPAPGDITIPAGKVVSGDRGQGFETTARRTLRKGQLSIAVPVRAQAEGPEGKVEAAAIKNVNAPIFGIESVVNEEPTFFAREKETDEELRRRIRGTLERAGKATLGAIRNSLIEGVSEVDEGNLQLTERRDSPGLVEIRFGLESRADPELVQRIEESIFASRAAGIRVVHNLAPAAPPAAPPAAAAGSGAAAALGSPGPRHRAEALPAEILGRMPEGVLRLRAEVFFRLVEPNVAVAEKERIEDELRDRVIDYLDELPMGADLVYNKLLGRLAEPREVADVALLIGPETAAGSGDLMRRNLATDGRKAAIDSGAVFVGLMDSAVRIDLRIAVEPRADTAAAAAAVAPVLEAAVRRAVEGLLARPGGEAWKLRLADLRAAVRPLVEGGGLQLAAGEALTLSAEYEETGRLLTGTEEVDLEGHHLAALDHLEVSLRGELDG